MKRWQFNNLPLIFLVVAIGLSPSFVVGQITGGKNVELRVEDLLMVVLGLVWIARFLASGKKRIEKPPLFLLILAWLGFGFLSLLINWIYRNSNLSWGFFYFLKEIQYFFLYFYVFYHIKDYGSAKSVINAWVWVGVINASWIIFELVTGLQKTYYYGPTPFIEPEGTFPGGGFFLITFVFLSNLVLHYYFSLNLSSLKKIFLVIFASVPAIGVISSGSRSCFIGLVFAFGLTLFIYALKKRFLYSFLVMMIFFVFLSGFFLMVRHPVLDRFLNVEDYFSNLDPGKPLSRSNIWISQLDEAAREPLFLFFGFGKSAILGGMVESHSQYVRNFIETGVVGSALFLLLVYIIAQRSFRSFLINKDPFLIGVSAGLFCCTLAMAVISIFAEGFLVVKIAEVYWLFVGLSMAVLKIASKNSEKNESLNR